MGIEDPRAWNAPGISGRGEGGFNSITELGILGAGILGMGAGDPLDSRSPRAEFLWEFGEILGIFGIEFLWECGEILGNNLELDSFGNI